MLSFFIFGCSNFIIRYKFIDKDQTNIGWEEQRIESYSSTHYKCLDTNQVFEVLIYSTGKVLTSGFVYLPIIPSSEYIKSMTLHEVKINLKSDLNIENLPEFVTIKFNGQQLNYKGKKTKGLRGIYYYEFNFEVDLTYIENIEIIFNELEIKNRKIQFPSLSIKREKIIYYRNSPFAS